MKKPTPMFPEFHLQTLRRKRRSPQQKLADHLAKIEAKNLFELEHYLGGFIPSKKLTPASQGHHSRQRTFTAKNCFWGFMSQVFSTDGGCREVLRHVQAAASLKGQPLPSSSTAAYCKARQKLSLEGLHDILAHTTSTLDRISKEEGLFGRRVLVVDGTGFSMPDTAQNQEVWPQTRGQKEGCGFPTARVAALFSLQTGALVSYRCGNKHDQEISLFREQWTHLNHGDIVLADKGFNNYRDVSLLQSRGVDSVMNLRRKPFSGREIIKTLGPNDWLVKWKRPQRIKGYSPDEWAALPPVLTARMLRIDIAVPGFRSQTIYLVTTLLDPVEYPAENLRNLYFQRWDVELFFRDIKITMGMDILRCRSPEMIQKELCMYFIAYNCVRGLIVEAAEEANVPIRRVSFKGALQALRIWETRIHGVKIHRTQHFKLLSDLYHCMTDTLVPDRPGRSV